jgi:hypothetical protein
MTQKTLEQLQKELKQLDKLIEEKRPLTKEEAKKFRETGLLKNITQSLIQGDSVKRTISKTTQSSIMGFKEKFDPLNISKMLAGTLGVAVVGKLTNRTQDEMQYFSGIKKSIKQKSSPQSIKSTKKLGNVDTNFYTTVVGKQSVKKGDSVSNVAAKLFSLYKKNIDEKKLQMELSRNFEKEIHNEDARRHKDLVSTLDKINKEKNKPKKRITGSKKLNVSKEDMKPGLISQIGSVIKDAGTAAAVVGAAVVGGDIFSQKTNTFKENKNDEFKKRSEVQKRVFNSFARAGFSKNQALALTAEVGRENGFRPEIMFGTHPEQAEQAKGRENVGIFSFAEGRNKNLRKFMAARGLTEMKDGKEVFQRSQASLDAQAEFIRSEMQSKGFESVKREFLDKPDISRDDAAVVLGDKYIKWRRTDPVYAKHNEYRNQYYAEVQSMVNKGENMEEPQYKKVSNETANVQSNQKLAIAGDSIAYGVGKTKLGEEAKTQATVGLSTKEIISAVKTKTTSDLSKKGMAGTSKNQGDVTNSDIAVISAGSNDWGNLTNLKNDLAELRKVTNAKKYIWVLPANTMPDGKNISGARKIVEAFANENRDSTVSFEPGKDQIHPKDPNKLQQDIRNKIKELEGTVTDKATKVEANNMNTSTDFVMFRGLNPESGTSKGVDTSAGALNEAGFKAKAFNSFSAPSSLAKDGSPLYGFSLGGKSVLDFANKNKNVKFSTAYLVDPYGDSLKMLLDNPPKNVDKFIVWYNPNWPYLKEYGLQGKLTSQGNIQFIPINGPATMTEHAAMPQKVLPTILADLQKNKSSQQASNNNGSMLNDKTKENQQLKDNVKPVSFVNNSSTTTQIGKKSDPRILIASTKDDLPPFMKVTF